MKNKDKRGGARLGAGRKPVLLYCAYCGAGIPSGKFIVHVRDCKGARA